MSKHFCVSKTQLTTVGHCLLLYYLVYAQLRLVFLNFPFVWLNISSCLKLNRPRLAIVYCYKFQFILSFAFVFLNFPFVWQNISACLKVSRSQLTIVCCHIVVIGLTAKRRRMVIKITFITMVFQSAKFSILNNEEKKTTLINIAYATDLLLCYINYFEARR